MKTTAPVLCSLALATSLTAGAATPAAAWYYEYDNGGAVAAGAIMGFALGTMASAAAAQQQPYYAPYGYYPATPDSSYYSQPYGYRPWHRHRYWRRHWQPY